LKLFYQHTCWLLVSLFPAWVLISTNSGSTATIIRLPYTSTLKPYKADFLYRTTDFAIWTTVEVGVGITAGCIATLKPLLRSDLLSLGVTRQSSGKPWSKDTTSKLGDNHGGQPLDELRPVIGDSVTTTTVTSERISSESDEETFLGTGVPSERWNCGVNKSVTTMVVEERAERRTAEERGKPVRVYECF
jgi:hypothetical protein